jgi:alanine racemase
LPRPTTAIIDLSSIEHNYNVIKKHCPKSQIYSVVKSNAYGHGVKKVVGALKKSDGFCVATIEEADEFREFSKKPLLCLQGFYDKKDLKLAHSHKIELVIHNEEQIDFWRS